MAAARVRPSVAILGCGAVGNALAHQLQDGWRKARVRGRILLWSRNRGAALRLARRLRQWKGGTTRVEILARAERALDEGAIVLLCVSDAAIAPMAANLARANLSGRKRPAILHTNGLLGTGCLAPLRELGFPVGRLHPFVAVARATPFLPGESSFGISGDPRATSAARGLVRWIDGRALRISSQDSGAYHAAASLLGGGLVALLELANRVLARAIVGRERRHKALSGLSWSVLLNIDTVGVGRALTGALARGAEDIVRGHVEVLRLEPRALDAYRVLGAVMLELARTRGSIDAATERRMRRLLGRPGRTG